MYKHLVTGLISFIIVSSSGAQQVDTLVDVGGYRMHFTVIKGTGFPILFDAGGGNDGTVWHGILEPISQITHATLITYDRPGFGKSELDTSTDDIAKHGIEAGIEGLEKGLEKLGYAGPVMLVPHSYAGFYSELFAYRHPEKVKGVVMIDANLASFYDDVHLAAMQADLKSAMEESKKSSPGRYYQAANFINTAMILRKSEFPVSIPVTDIVADHPPFGNEADDGRWRKCHAAFDAAAPNRQGITAKGCGHYVFIANPPLAIHAISNMYASLQNDTEKASINRRSASYAVSISNDFKAEQALAVRSEGDLNNWGYELIKQKRPDAAIQVFILNTKLHPESVNAWDSLAEAYEVAGNRAEAVKNYTRVLELDPKAENATNHLKKLKAF